MAASIRIPWRSRDEPLDGQAIEQLPRALPAPDRAVARELFIEARGAGCRTVGDALDLFNRATTAERRAYADGARGAVGAPTLADEDKRLESARASRFPSPAPAPPVRDAEGKAIQQCPAEGCENVSTTPQGALRPVPDRRWFCPSHKHLAAPGDDEPDPDLNVVRLSPFGTPLPRREVEEFYAAEYRREERRLREEDEGRAEERERLANLEEEYASGLRPPPGFGPQERSNA
ncbi:MAG: hypothetical protein ACRDMH_13215 [Solirubrobacterales bacterium]